MVKVIIEYVWIGGSNELRSKTRICDFEKNMSLKKINKNICHYISKWNYDGSSTKQASGDDSEVIIYPCKAIKCPFRKGNNLIVMCDTYTPKDEPLETNKRFTACELFEECDNFDEDKPWYGMEQEFFMMDCKTNKPLGFENIVNKELEPKEQGQYYCSVGSVNNFGRNIMEKVLENMLYSDLDVSGINAEVAPGQWEYQIGPVCGIDAGDQLWLSRYILERTCEEYNVMINYEPKLSNYTNWNGSGMHTNFSTKKMRESNGIKYIKKAIKRLSKKHKEHMKVYGDNNEGRMTGEHETASYDKFSWGVADRGASVRVGNDVNQNGCGYFEDRRPGANADPYLVTAMIYNTCCK